MGMDCVDKLHYLLCLYAKYWQHQREVNRCTLAVHMCLRLTQCFHQIDTIFVPEHRSNPLFFPFHPFFSINYSQQTIKRGTCVLSKQTLFLRLCSLASLSKCAELTHLNLYFFTCNRLKHIFIFFLFKKVNKKSFQFITTYFIKMIEALQ